MDARPFVAREGELAQLGQFLDRSLDGQGHVCFVTGEAGSGKTALVTEFARRAQEAHRDLVIAVGQCDAHTGMGDPYLPFRELLCQLTGDVEAKLAQGAISQENARRLRQLVVISCKILVEVAPDLVGLFVPGAKLVGELGKAAVEKAGWLDKLQKLAEAPLSRSLSGGTGLEQSQVFEQYTNMLVALAERQPLLLIVDDLHWADAASLGLLFRLGRRLEGNRILILGAYRPEEAALDRRGERHPLQKVLAEFKRYSGEIRVDLDRSRETGGKHFVRALLATEPNRLSGAFRHVLFQHTRGHPLFTVALLRDMQQRGALVHDDQGRWIEGPYLDWNDLPDRVEGLIEERIGRLEEAERSVLSTACVEGQDFTAQVIAQVEELDERDLLRMLSQELEKRHRLVQEQDEVELDHRFLTRYRFAHALVQQYLYNSLGLGERRVLHGTIATLLEELYQAHTERVAVQLARHYFEAGISDKAAEYLFQAGNAAFRLHANEEAQLHYDRALDVLSQLPDTVDNRQRRVDALIKRVASSWVADPTEENLERLARAEGLMEGLADTGEVSSSNRLRLANIRFWMGRVQFRGVRMSDAISHFTQGLPIAQAIGDPGLVAMLLAGMGFALSVQGRCGQAEPLLRQAMAIQEGLPDRSDWLQTLAYHGCAVALMGDHAAGVAEIVHAFTGAQEMGHIPLACTVAILLATARISASQPSLAVEATRQAVQAAEKAGDRFLLYTGYGWQGWTEGLAGLLEAAEASMARSLAIARELGGRLLFADWFMAARAQLALGAGRVREALGLAEQAVAIAREVDNPAAQGYARLIWGKALAELGPPRWAGAEAQFAESWRLFELAQCRLWVAQTRAAWGTLCRDQGDLATAREHWEAAAARWEASDITWELDKVRALIDTLGGTAADDS